MQWNVVAVQRTASRRGRDGDIYVKLTAMIVVTRWHWAGVTAFWLFIAAMYAAQIVWIAQLPGERVNVRSALIWQFSYYAAWIPLTILVWRVSTSWLAEGRASVAALLLRHVLLFAGVLLAVVAVASLLAPLLLRQQERLTTVYVMQLQGRAHLMVLIYAGVAGTGAAMMFFERYRERQAAEVKLQSELAAARLQALRAHLEPHFLFNSLHTIASLARAHDTSTIVRLTASVSEILRYVLENGDRPARLGDEFGVVSRYLDIQCARFSDRLKTTVSISADVVDAHVPRLVVQPLVENALKHGLGPRIQQGTLTVRAWRDGEATLIAVEDDGAGLPAGWALATTSGTGLRNLAERLAAEFGQRAALTVSARPQGGVVASVTLPYRTV